MMRRFTKVFGIGLSRTGTHSLTDALAYLGLSAIHFPATFADVEAHRAATDTRIADTFELLDRAFPGSLFILTVRDMDDWLRSCECFWAGFGNFVRAPELMKLHERLYGSAHFDAAIYRAAYLRHINRVDDYFVQRRHELLTMNICAGDGWRSLVDFLEVDMPMVPFPSVKAPARLNSS
jgi:hypothetical protein